jgi:XTP/dITP diphosphohydrolase
MTEIVIASKNRGKIAEFAGALAALPVKVLALSDFGDIPDAREDGDTFAANAIKKALYYARFTGKACLADDSGLEVDALDGAPGVFSARYAGENANSAANNQKLLTALQAARPDERTARFRCVLAYAAENDAVITADGVCEGVILEEPRGTGGFGYDSLFYMPDLKRTMAEMTMAEKNAVSHRGRAIRAMVRQLAEKLK